MSDNITMPREVVQLALEAFEAVMPFSTTQRELKIRAVEALRTALAAEQPKHDLMKWAKDAGSSPEDLERFATYTIATRDMEIATLREENEALRRDAERYRWLQDAGQKYWMEFADMTAEATEAAIDAAMEGKR